MKKILLLAVLVVAGFGEKVDSVTKADNLLCMPLEVWQIKGGKTIRVYSEIERNEMMVKFPVYDNGRTIGKNKMKYAGGNNVGYMIYQESEKSDVWMNIKKIEDTIFYDVLFAVQSSNEAVKYKCIPAKND